MSTALNPHWTHNRLHEILIQQDGLSQKSILWGGNVWRFYFMRKNAYWQNPYNLMCASNSFWLHKNTTNKLGTNSFRMKNKLSDLAKTHKAERNLTSSLLYKWLIILYPLLYIKESLLCHKTKHKITHKNKQAIKITCLLQHKVCDVADICKAREICNVHANNLNSHAT